MFLTRATFLGLALALLGLWPALAAGSVYAAGLSAPPAPGYVEGLLPGGTGGSFATYTLAYPGDGSPVELALWVSTADPNVLQGTGVNVYGPTPGKVYAQPPFGGAQRRTAGFSSNEPGKYVVQVFNYTPVAVGFSLTTNRPLGGGRSIVLDPGHGGPEIGAVTPGGDLL